MKTEKELQCAFCQATADLLIGKYPISNLHGYNLPICDLCRRSNYDGWRDPYEAKLLAHLEANDIPVPQRLDNGRLPLEF